MRSIPPLIIIQSPSVSAMAISSFPRQSFLIIPLISCALFCFFSGGYAVDPARMIEKALLCFNNRLTQIYNDCDEEYRLNESGNLNVPPQITDQFCSGPCLPETQHLLNCVDNIFPGFEFNNKAGVRAISDTIRGACSFGRQRGNFNVGQYTSPASSINSMSFYGWIVLGLCFLMAENLI